MKILGIVGSPHKNGLTNQLVEEVLKGAAADGAITEIMYLADYDIRPCVGCQGATCWNDGKCRFDEKARERNMMLGKADGLVFGAPVYIHDINGLSKDYIDKVRVPPRGGRYGPFQPTNGKPAIAVTVAGGTGKGVLTSLQAIHYGFFFLCGFRALEPMPVARFNLLSMLEEAQQHGRLLAEIAQTVDPFEAEGLADRMAYYQTVSYTNSDPVADNLYLAEILISELREKVPADAIAEMEEAVAEAKDRIAFGNEVQAADAVWRAYLMGSRHWDELRL